MGASCLVIRLSHHPVRRSVTGTTLTLIPGLEAPPVTLIDTCAQQGYDVGADGIPPISIGTKRATLELFVVGE
jgi:hypothetical protein